MLLENMRSQTIFLALLLLSFTHAELSMGYPSPGISCNGNNQIQVSGQGVVTAPPDEAVVNVEFQVDAKTSSEAIDVLAGRVEQLVLAIQERDGTTY